jgi:hypothetical protein
MLVLDARHSEAELSSANRRHIASGSAADDDQIEASHAVPHGRIEGRAPGDARQEKGFTKVDRASGGVKVDSLSAARRRGGLFGAAREASG